MSEFKHPNDFFSEILETFDREAKLADANLLNAYHEWRAAEALRLIVTNGPEQHPDEDKVCDFEQRAFRNFLGVSAKTVQGLAIKAAVGCETCSMFEPEPPTDVTGRALASLLIDMKAFAQQAQIGELSQNYPRLRIVAG